MFGRKKDKKKVYKTKMNNGYYPYESGYYLKHDTPERKKDRKKYGLWQ